MPKHTLKSVYDGVWFSTTLALAVTVLLAAVILMDRQENEMRISELQKRVYWLEQYYSKP